MSGGCLSRIYCAAFGSGTGGGSGTGPSVWTEAEKNSIIANVGTILSKTPDNKPIVNSDGEVRLNVNQETAIRNRELS